MSESTLIDLAAERAVIAGIVRHGKDAYFEIRDVVTEECFSHVNRCIFASLKSVLDANPDRKIDIATISSASREIGLYNELEGEGKYISGLFSFNVEFDNVREFAVKIRKLAEIKSLICKIDETKQSLFQLTGKETMSEICSIAEKPIFEFSNKLTTGSAQIQQIGEGLDEYMEYLANNPDEVKGISIGCPIYEKLIGGIQNGVHVTGARKKTGKSFKALNDALYVAAITKTPTFFVDTELRLSNGGWLRFVTRLADGVTYEEIKYGTYLHDEDKVRKVRKAQRILNSIPLNYVNITGKSFEELVSLIRRWLVRHVGYDNKGKLNKCFVVFDYLKLSDYSLLKSMQEYQILGYQMNVLHDLTQQYNFPLSLFVQLNKEMQISASDRISWACTSYASLYKKTEEELREDITAGNLRLVIEDARHGEGMEPGDYVNYHFNGHLAKMTEGKTRNQIVKSKEMNKNDDAN